MPNPDGSPTAEERLERVETALCYLVDRAADLEKIRARLEPLIPRLEKLIERSVSEDGKVKLW